MPRAVGVLGLVALATGLLYLAARQTSLFALRDIQVRGAPDSVSASVREALDRFVGHSLVGLSRARLETAIEALPTVVSATVDRNYPHTVRVAVRTERPVAVVRQADDAWLVSARGRIMQHLEPGDLTSLPRVWLARSVQGLEAGAFVLSDQGGDAVRALARLPRPFPVPVESASGTSDAVVIVLRGKMEVRLGEAENLRLKLRVAAAVLRSLSPDERGALEYLDVSLPTRPVAMDKSQVVTTALDL